MRNGWDRDAPHTAMRADSHRAVRGYFPHGAVARCGKRFGFAQPGWQADDARAVDSADLGDRAGSRVPSFAVAADCELNALTEGVRGSQRFLKAGSVRHESGGVTASGLRPYDAVPVDKEPDRVARQRIDFRARNLAALRNAYNKCRRRMRRFFFLRDD